MGICCCSICGALCFSQAQTKTLEIVLICLNSISFILLLFCLIVIKWKELNAADAAFFSIMFIMSILFLIFSILLRYWRAKNLIKGVRKRTGISFCTAGLILVIINFIICLIEEIVFTISFYKADYPCRNFDNTVYIYRRISSDVDCKNKPSNYLVENITFGQYFIAYVTFSYLELGLILEMILWNLLKSRINLDLDGPPQIQSELPPHMVDPYGRAVVVVQPGDVVMMGGNQYQYNPYAQNQPNLDRPNIQYPGSNDYQIQEKIS